MLVVLLSCTAAAAAAATAKVVLVAAPPLTHHCAVTPLMTNTLMVKTNRLVQPNIRPPNDMYAIAQPGNKQHRDCAHRQTKLLNDFFQAFIHPSTQETMKLSHDWVVVPCTGSESWYIFNTLTWTNNPIWQLQTSIYRVMLWKWLQRWWPYHYRNT